jgi:hypothetical protein
MPSSSLAVRKHASTDHRENAMRSMSRTVAPLRPGTRLETKYLVSPVSIFRATSKHCFPDGILCFFDAFGFSTLRQNTHHFTSQTCGPLLVSLMRYRCQFLSRSAGEYVAKLQTSDERLGRTTFAFRLRPRVSLVFLGVIRTLGSIAQP